MKLLFLLHRLFIFSNVGEQNDETTLSQGRAEKHRIRERWRSVEFAAGGACAGRLDLRRRAARRDRRDIGKRTDGAAEGPPQPKWQTAANSYGWLAGAANVAQARRPANDTRA